MKQYQTPKFMVCVYSQDVITSSTSLDTYDDMGSWMNGWATGGNNE